MQQQQRSPTQRFWARIFHSLPFKTHTYLITTTTSTLPLVFIQRLFKNQKPKGIRSKTRDYKSIAACLGSDCIHEFTLPTSYPWFRALGFRNRYCCSIHWGSTREGLLLPLQLNPLNRLALNSKLFLHIVRWLIWKSGWRGWSSRGVRRIMDTTCRRSGRLTRAAGSAGLWVFSIQFLLLLFFCFILSVTLLFLFGSICFFVSWRRCHDFWGF